MFFSRLAPPGYHYDFILALGLYFYCWPTLWEKTNLNLSKPSALRLTETSDTWELSIACSWMPVSAQSHVASVRRSLRDSSTWDKIRVGRIDKTKFEQVIFCHTNGNSKDMRTYLPSWGGCPVPDVPQTSWGWRGTWKGPQTCKTRGENDQLTRKAAKRETRVELWVEVVAEILSLNLYHKEI